MVRRTHQPSEYVCPFCALLRGAENTWNRRTDIVAVTELAWARVSPRWWPDDPGSALVMPRSHHENLYDLPSETGHALWDLTREVAVAMRSTYDCAGVSTRQHNEPAGGQDVWHLHVHVLPRQTGDRLYQQHDASAWAQPEERSTYADRLASALGHPRLP